MSETSPGPADEPDIVEAIAVSSLIHSISNRMTSTGTTTYGLFGLGFQEARLLYVLLTTPPMSASRLSERLGVDPAAISRATARLIDQGIVEKGPGPRRALLLTPAGQRLAETVAAAFEERSFRLIAGVPYRELKRALKVLEHLQANLARVAALAEELRPEPEPAVLRARRPPSLISLPCEGEKGPGEDS